MARFLPLWAGVEDGRNRRGAGTSPHDVTRGGDFRASGGLEQAETGSAADGGRPGVHVQLGEADPAWLRDAKAEQAFDRLNPHFGVPADRTDRIGHRDVQQRERALSLGVRVAVHDSRQNDRDPIIWQPSQDYRTADAIQAARTQPTRTRWGPERLGPER
jgi:hypothetical protein